MNFLQLAQEVDKLSLTQGSISTVTPTNEFQSSIINRVQVANHMLNTMRKDWLFNWVERDISVTSLAPSYTPSDIRAWEDVYYDNKALYFTPYWQYLREDWTLNPTKPYKYTVAPDKSIITNALDANYLIKGTGYLNPDTLSLASDVPRIPVEYHYLIVWEAIISLGNSLFLSNILQEATINRDKMLGQMMRDYVPSRGINRRPFV